MGIQSRLNHVKDQLLTKSVVNLVAIKIIKTIFGDRHFLFVAFSLGLALTLSLNWVSAGYAQNKAAFIRQVRSMEPEETSLSNPTGLAFSSRANAFQVVEWPGRMQPPSVDTDVVMLAPFAVRAGSIRIGAALQNPLNMAFDNQANRLLVIQPSANILIEIMEDSAGNLDPATLVRHDVRHFGLRNPQGMSIDPASGHLFILDGVGPQIVRVEPELDGGFENAEIASVSLEATGLLDVRSLALDPVTSHLHLISLSEQRLYELTQFGQVVATRDLSEFGLKDPQGMVFAPSGDQTDDPLQMSLYLADRGVVPGQSPRSGLLPGGSSDVQSTDISRVTQDSGQIVELSFTELPAPAASSFTSSLVGTTDMSAFSPPSPDPSGLAYLPSSNTLMMSDGEVEETVGGITHFEGANVWELTLAGNVVDTANISRVSPTVVPMSNEPTGVAWVPANGHFFFSDDGAKKIFDLNPGPDAQIGTADDTWSSFDTTTFGSTDPEGIAYDTLHNRLFVADGVNMEVYEFTLAGSLVNQFDVAQYGIVDPESVEFNANSGTLFILSSNRNSPVAVETDLSGNLLQTIDFSAANPRAAAGLAYAPASNGSGAQHFYVVDRGIDNNSDPNIIDGKMYELTAPAPTTPGNTPPLVDAGVDQTVTITDNAVLDGSVTDDGLPDPPGAVTVEWSKVSGPGTTTFTDANSVDTTVSFSSIGTYILSLVASDGELSGSDQVNIEVTGSSGQVYTEVRVAASTDDAEERASGSMDIASSDLELVQAGSNQTVGMRFNGLDIPQGSTITNAYVQFQVDEIGSVETSLTIQGEDVDHALTFGSASNDITSRPRTSAAVPWTPSPWSTVGEAGADQQTPNIAAVIQEIVNRPGWVSGNSLAIIVTGTGTRTAEAYDGVSSAAPLLYVEYVPGGPVVSITSPAGGSTFTAGDAISFSATASDPEDGDLAASLEWISDLDGAIGTGSSFDRLDLSVGTHTITASVVDSTGLSGSDSISLTVFPNTNVLVGAGDIATCDTTGDEETSSLLNNIAGTVFTLGDNVYPDGTDAEFNDCYDPTWGLHKTRTRPAPGNHDYHTPGASGYFNYFGASAGNPTEGYYSYDVGSWHIIVLNSECSAVGGCDVASPQGQWLQADLAANPSMCTLAYWHTPLFSSDSVHGNSASVYDFWTMLYQAGTDVVLNGHAHTYERFALQDPNGSADPQHGIREFIVGTGGRSLYPFGTIQSNSEVRNSDTFGVLKLTLNANSYDWEFIPAAGQTFSDVGSASCVSPPLPNTAPEASDDAYATDEDTVLDVVAPGVLSNDSDGDGDPLTAVLVTGPGNGSLTLNSDGSFTYTPNTDFNGTDSFGYRANDGKADSTVATVTITVNAVNDAPVANANGPYAGSIGVPVQFDGSGSSDVDGSIVSYDWDFGDGNAGSGVNPTHSYAAEGIYTVVLTVTDDGGATDSHSTSADIQAEPNQAPVAVDDDYAADEDVALDIAAPGVLTNDTDADNDALTAVLVTGPGNGSLTLDSDGSFIYTPNADFNGTDAFTYQANDGVVGSGTATVTITVNAVNDAPVAEDDAYVTNEDTVLNVAAPGVLSNDSDVDGDLLTAVLVTPTSNGGLTLNSDGSFGYTPNSGFTGTDSFTYHANDGTADSSVSTVTITINASAPGMVEVRVANTSDDAEENTSGRVALNSSDLEMVEERTIQVVGMRFNGLAIPPGATILNAYLQFQVDQTDSVATDLIIQGQAADNAGTFVNTSGDISSRVRTSAQETWSPPPWTTRGEQGPDQRSINIASVIQEIVDRPGWASGNSLVIIITGTGKRVAESYNGDQAGAPLLHVEFVTAN